MANKAFKTVMALAGLTVLAGGAWLANDVWSYRSAHLTLTKRPCYLPACLAYQLDLFGDGTLVAQGGMDGPVAYHLNPVKTALVLWRLDHSAFRRETWQAGGSSEGGGCDIILAHAGRVTENGCMVEVNGAPTDQAHPEALQPLDDLIGLDPAAKTGPVVNGHVAVPYVEDGTHKVERILWRHDPPPP